MRTPLPRWTAPLALVLVVTAVSPGRSEVECDADNGGIRLPPGYCAQVVADLIGIARHIAVGPRGALYVSTSHGPGSVSHVPRIARDRATSNILVLRDSANGRLGVIQRIPINGRTGIVVARDNRYLYASDSAFVLRFRLADDGRILTGLVDTIVSGMPDDLGHRTKSLALDDAGGIFVSLGSRTNACRERRGDVAPDPCPEMPVRSGIWRYDAAKRNQRHPADGERWATGVRNGMGLAWSQAARAIFATSHGRDGLASNFPQYYTLRQNAETPTEEFFRVDRGVDIGWPYCFHDSGKRQKVLAPEYGGDGQKVGRCERATMPLIGFPGHWGPNALIFYSGSQFPLRFRNGAFIAFHGSWNRMPLAEAGYNVVFVPFEGNVPTGRWEVFADGFAGDTLEPVLARHRPTGFAQAPDGSLYVSDDMRGRIWAIRYRSR